MTLLLATLATISIASPDTLESPTLEPCGFELDVQLGQAPKLPPWPEGLPRRIRHEDGSVTLPPALSRAVQCRLILLDAVPRHWQRSLDLLKQAHGAEMAAAVMEASQPEGWSTYELAIGVLGGVVVGCLLVGGLVIASGA